MKSVFGAFLSPVAAALGVFKKPKAAAAPMAPAARDDTLRAIAQEDALSKRRGGAADILTGAGGAEAGPASAKDLLGQ